MSNRGALQPIGGPFQMGMSMLSKSRGGLFFGKGVKFGLGIPMEDGKDFNLPIFSPSQDHLTLRTQARPGICKC